jgi:PAS domain S-box-containing protein
MAKVRTDDPFASRRPLRLLIVEDNPADAELMVAILKRAGFPLTFEVVDSAALFQQRLAEGTYDAILCDHNLRTWTGMTALETLRQSAKEIPFVVVTAALGDEAAVEYIKQGAADYVLKHRLERLPAVVGRALREKAHREENRRLQEQILCAKREWELTFDTVPDAVLLLDEEYRIQRANRAATELLGLQFSQFIGKPCYEVLHRLDNPPSDCPHHRMVQSGNEERGELAEPSLNKVFYVTASPLRDARGALKGCVRVMRDITEPKRAEEALRSSEERYRALFQGAGEGILVADIETMTFVYANPAVCRMLGYTEEELARKGVSDLHSRKDLEWIVAGFMAQVRGERAMLPNTPCLRKDGVTIYADVLGTQMVIDGKNCNVGFFTDVTERKRAEDALRESEARYRLMVEGSEQVFFYIRDAQHRFEYLSPSVKDVLGYDPEELLGQPYDALLTSSLADAIVQEMSDGALRDGHGRSVYSVVHRHKDGRIIALEIVESPIKHEGRAVGIRGFARDITERQRAEEALEQSEQRLAAIFEASRDGIVVEENERIVYANPSCAQLYGYDNPTELVGRHLSVILAPEDRERVLEYDRRRLRGELVPSIYEFKGKRKDGTAIDLEASASTFTIAGRPHIITVVRNIAERKLLEAQLRQSQKMEAVGRLAGGIAHDFNNLLGVVIGYSEILMERLGPGSPLHKKAEEIKKAGCCAASLTKQLLAFSRKQVLELRIVNLNAAIAAMDDMLRRMIGEDIELVTVSHPALGRVKADQSQIEQVILNLAVNSRDAMPEGGKLTIETANVELDEAYVRCHSFVPVGRYVMLAVSDTGVGMDAETQSHIFEPFFTTKETGKGTGLGLPTVYGIIQQSGGYIWVYSEPGQGTTFKIYLPRVEEAVEAPGLSEAHATAPGGSETVLLVEDAEPLRRIARELLEASGYAVLEARDGAEAIQIGEQHQEPIHLLVTDVVMPGMSGRELGERLAALRPEMKVLYVSGYTDDAIVRHRVLGSGLAFLQKPFTRDTLARKVREVLDTKGSRNSSE